MGKQVRVRAAATFLILDLGTARAIEGYVFDPKSVDQNRPRAGNAGETSSPPK
eukprot:CAMPEP_0197450506 /NCGR_PEP_ID=MMETSP1175-20131217/25583_1 /TAXON_ID=1003142 /ORGANISM="Triceratium dubium, Strain CCMP147" /LENGTH=52 /DNA_ID=CAMNT_0042982945 /DNA_START=790 /DNA_END=948 /DNA_ORIENTATION=-